MNGRRQSGSLRLPLWTSSRSAAPAVSGESESPSRGAGEVVWRGERRGAGQECLRRLAGRLLVAAVLLPHRHFDDPSRGPQMQGDPLEMLNFDV